MTVYSQISDELKQIKSNGLYRKIPAIAKTANKFIEINGSVKLNCASNDYLGLSHNSQVKEASIKAIETYGNSSGSSRVVCGNYDLFDKLEQEMAKFKNCESCLVVNTGFMANLLIISTLACPDSIIFTDKLNHASIYDGIKLSGAKMLRYKHNDIDHLKILLKKYAEHSKKILVTDTLFSMDGDKAKLKELSDLKYKYNFLLMVDEAHATGIFGKGKGLVHEEGVERDIDINMGTFSKALGGFGAYVCADKTIIEYLVNKGRGLIFTTSLPPAVIGGNLKSLEIVSQQHEKYGKKLLDHCSIFKDLLTKENIDCGETESQIFPIVFKNNNSVMEAQRRLLKSGIYAALARRPSVPTPRLRISLRADFTKEDLVKIVRCLKQII
ncbi:8-amino-7-oxononanoate synthase [Flexistipes sinusarabici DSM 4947]|uniref:8-amino-7-oxononanoate synthase n=1 Tax=Flexistipes sinusarabici (strain ATCC 49648 / DSM 4947 / MAS 10) TaxID=717231 RepID=F8E4G7_FLESM|nr:8-amino-7-oxononanoate synthase [Flexistipes sinusarabici]AEI14453.1 8-amino-7-oxononanoate synthase [Flexistipes sinusarabici DSM 4947]